MDQIFDADGDHGTVAGDDDDLADAASVKLPLFLRNDAPRSARAPLDTDLDSPSLIASRKAPRPPEPSISDEETQAEDDTSRR